MLVVKPSSLGDVVHTLPAVAMIKQRWPDCHLRWVINPEWAALLEGNPFVDEVILFPRREFRGMRGALRILPWARRLRERVQADLVIDFQGLLRSALIAKLCRRKGGRIVGLSDAREGARHFYDQRVEVSGCVHAVDRYLALARELTQETAGQPAELRWPLPPGVPHPGVSISERYVVLHPFSRGAGKSLSAGQIAGFCESIAPQRVVLVGRTGEAVSIGENVIDLVNQTTLPQLIWVLRHAAFIVSVDSGPMHIASALTERLLSIHTWSDPAKVGPYREGTWIWKDGQISRRGRPDETSPAPEIRDLAAFVRQRLEPPRSLDSSS